jgi:hypothetical protein
MKKKQAFEVESSVQWKWMGRWIAGVVKEVHFETVEKTLKEKKIKRNGSKENPAYLVESVAGNQALKLHSELTPSSPADTKAGSSKSRPRPKMFS